MQSRLDSRRGTLTDVAGRLKTSGKGSGAVIRHGTKTVAAVGQAHEVSRLRARKRSRGALPKVSFSAPVLRHVRAAAMDSDDQVALAQQHRGAPHGVVGHPEVAG